MPLFGVTHVALLAAVAAASAALAWLCRSRRVPLRAVRLALGCGLALNEIVWWGFRYTHEGLHWTNLPLQLCDATVWGAVAACLTLRRGVVEFAYFAGLAGAGMALLTPDLWSPWPSYPAIYFFAGHGGIVMAATALVFGRMAPLERGALWRAFGWMLAYTAAMAVFNLLAGANYMYLCRKPLSETLLDRLGPWPVYIVVGLALSLAMFGLLWLPARPKLNKK